MSTTKQNKFGEKFVTITEKSESLGVKSNANKSGFFNGINDFFKQESEIGSFKQFCFKSVNLSKVERERRKQ